MSYDIFSCYKLNKIHDSYTENYDYKNTNVSEWKIVDSKRVLDSDGFYTDYTWYTNGDTHIFMFGDNDITDPDEDYADWVAETEKEAREWFESYVGFEEYESSWDQMDDINEDTDYHGNADFMNDGFGRVYSNGDELED